MTGNLLIDADSFRWTDFSDNKSTDLENMFTAYDIARNYGDIIFGHPDLWNLSIDNVFFHEIFYWTEQERLRKIPWMGDVILQMLIQLFSYANTSCRCQTVEEMDDIEFPDQLNGLIGCQQTNFRQNYVNCEANWLFWHRTYFVSRPPSRIDFCEQLSPFFPNLYFNASSIVPGLNGLHISHTEIMKTILHHLSALNDVFYPKFMHNPLLGGDGVCDFLEDHFKPHPVQIRASRDRNDCSDITFEFIDIRNGQAKNLYCDLHTKFRDYFEFPNPSHEAKSNRIYFYQPITGFLDGKLLIGRIGRHARCG